MSQEKIERWNEIEGNLGSQQQLQAFLDSSSDSYAILQLRRTDETTDERFMSYGYLQSHGKEPDIDHYDVVYVAELPTNPPCQSGRHAGGAVYQVQCGSP